MRQRNRLKSVFFALDIRWKEEQTDLEAALRRDGILCEPMDDGLFITDQAELARKAAEKGMVCIGIDREMKGYFEGAVLVCENLDTLDLETLEAVYLRSKGLPVTIAQTERLTLREIAEEDIEGLCRISSMPGMEHLMPEGKMVQDFFKQESLKSYISTVYRFYGYGLWSVFLKDGTLIGCCGLQDYVMPTEEDGCLELQYMLAPAYWGNGYGTEMCSAALGYAWTHTEAECCCVRCHPENVAAIALAKKLGFEKTVDEESVFWKRISDNISGIL